MLARIRKRSKHSWERPSAKLGKEYGYVPPVGSIYVRTLRFLDRDRFLTWKTVSGTSYYSLEYKNEISIPNRYFVRWLKGKGISRLSQSRLLALGVPASLLLEGRPSRTGELPGGPELEPPTDESSSTLVKEWPLNLVAACLRTPSGTERPMKERNKSASGAKTLLSVVEAAQLALEVFRGELVRIHAEKNEEGEESGAAASAIPERPPTRPHVPAAATDVQNGSDGIPTASRETSKLRSVAWLAEVLGCSEWAARNAISTKKLPSRCIVRMGRSIRLNEANVLAWLENPDAGD